MSQVQGTLTAAFVCLLFDNLFDNTTFGLICRAGMAADTVHGL